MLCMIMTYKAIFNGGFVIMKHKLISHIISATTKHKKIVLLITFILLIISILSVAVFLKINLSFKGLVGDKIDIVKDYDKVIRDFKASALIVVTVQPTEEIKNAVQSIKDRMSNIVPNSNEMNELEGKINDIISSFKNRCCLFSEELKSILLSGKKTDGSFKDEKLSDIVNGVLYNNQMSFSNDKLMYMLMIAPKKNVDDIVNSIVLAKSIEIELNKLKKKYSDIVIKRGGFSILAMDEQEATLENFWLMLVLTILAITFIFFIGFRKIKFLVLSLIPLSISIVIMFGIFSLTIGELNLFSIMTPILLFGLGIDYAIHFGIRYGEIRAVKGFNEPQENILKETLNSIGGSLSIGALTTLSAFLSFLSSTINGFIHLSIIASIGIISSFLSMIYLLPILIMWIEKKYKRKKNYFIKINKPLVIGKLSISKLGLIISILLILIAGYSIVEIPKIQLEKDALNMEPKNQESVEVVREIEKAFSLSDIQTFYVINGYDKLKLFLKEVKSRIGNDYKYKTINIDMIMDAKRSIRVFEKLGWEKGSLESLPKYKEKYINKSSMFGNKYKKDLAEFYEFIINNYVNWENKKYLVAIPPVKSVWNKDFLKIHMEELKELETETGVIGAGFVKVWSFIVNNIIKDLVKSSIIALTIVIFNYC